MGAQPGNRCVLLMVRQELIATCILFLQGRVVRQSSGGVVRGQRGYNINKYYFHVLSHWILVTLLLYRGGWHD